MSIALKHMPSVDNDKMTDRTETSLFCELLNTFFDCMNVRSISEGKRERNKWREPYWTSNDFRFKVLYICNINF